MYRRASTLSKAVHTKSRLSKKGSLKKFSVSGATLDSYEMAEKAGFMAFAAFTAVVDLRQLISLNRKRNCRLKLLFSIISMSVTCVMPADEVEIPIMAQFLIISQPIAPAPTRNVFSLLNFSCTSCPYTAIWESYRQPRGATSAMLRLAGSEARVSVASK